MVNHLPGIRHALASILCSCGLGLRGFDQNVRAIQELPWSRITASMDDLMEVLHQLVLRNVCAGNEVAEIEERKFYLT